MPESKIVDPALAYIVQNERVYSTSVRTASRCSFSKLMMQEYGVCGINDSPTRYEEEAELDLS